mmetsp:Transcript_514/g.869  ORF Transcript_514/g.869 Transcript_514/m.869 type:complete len:236 (-) Transcript_514:77-784(-)
MGCCTSRELPLKNQLQEETLGKKEIASEIAPASYLPLETIQDPKALEIYNYVKQLSNWETVITEDWLTIKKLDFSQYSKDYPVTYATIKFDSVVPFQTFLDQLNTPETRLKWDPNIKQLETKTLSQGTYLQYRLVSTFGYKGDFVEKRFIVKDQDKLVQVFFSEPNEDYPEQKGLRRGSVLMGYHEFSHQHGKTIFKIISQIDINHSLGKMLAKLGPKKYKDWCKLMFKRINSVS